MSESVKLKESTTPERKSKYAPYEPKATQLVEQIQAGIDETKNKDRLLTLLYPFVVNIAKSVMYEHYQIEDIEDAVQVKLDKHICSKREGWYGKNGHHYIPYVYKYNQEYHSDRFDASENCFCGYLNAVLIKQFQTWYRELPDVIRVKEEVLNEKTGEYEIKIRYIRSCTSLDASNPDDEGNKYESSKIVNASAIKEYKEAQRTEVEALRQVANAALVKEVAFIYRDFFNHVNSLDESSNKKRAVHERGILVFHLIFAIEKLSSAKTIIFKSGDPDTYYDEKLSKRPTSFRELAVEIWAKPLEQVVSYQNDDYQLVLLTEIDFFNRLRLRIGRKGISTESFLDSESDILNKAYGWNETIERRVKDDYGSIPDKINEARRKIGNAIM